MKSNPALSLPRALFNRELGLSMASWMLFLTAAALYCLVYNQVVLISPTSFINSFLWSLREYAVWLAITPLLFLSLRQIHHKTNPAVVHHYALLIAISLGVVLALRLTLGASNTQQPTLSATLINWLPSQLGVLSLLIALWHVFFRTAQAPKPISHKPDSYCDKVRVIKGNGEAFISWAAVDFISAAGNYMELSCGAEKYLLRTTLKELEQQLPAQQFVRVHRSHIVNVAAIRTIGAPTSGNSVIELRNHHRVPLSKSYKTALNAHFFVPDSSH